MNKSKIFGILMIFVLTISGFAIDFTGTAPQFSGNVAFQNALNSTFNDFLSELNDAVGGINVKPEQLIRAFGNSSVYASHGATNRGYAGYKSFSFGIGSMVGAQLPVNPLAKDNSLSGILGNIKDNLLHDGDIVFGISPQVLNLNVGINASFLMKHLYLGLRVGYFNFPNQITDKFLPSSEMLDGLSLKGITLGVTANYQLIRPVNLLLLEWRGINIGSGIIYSNTKLNYLLPLDNFNQTITGGANLQIDPSLSLDMNITTVTIPIEVFTAVRLLFLNIPVGLGVDLAFGKSEVNIGLDAEMNIVGAPGGLTQTSSGNISTNAGGSMTPSFMNLKLMTGIGLELGPVIIDIPITWYFKDNGFSIGVTIGFSL